MSSVCGAEVRHCAPVDRHHVDRGDQGVGQLLVPVLQPLDELGDLQAVLAFLPLVDSLVRVTIVGRALQNQSKDMNQTEPLWHLPRMKAPSESHSRECAGCVYVWDASMAQRRKETMTNTLMVLLKQTLKTSITKQPMKYSPFSPVRICPDWCSSSFISGPSGGGWGR